MCPASLDHSTPKCNDCLHKDYAPLNEKVISMHLRGVDNKGNAFVAGIYPLCQDETCWFLAIDFDKGEWEQKKPEK
jgi:hypothetical protein